MTIEEAITAELEADAAVSVLVGSRIHLSNFPPGESFPLVTFNEISQGRFYTFVGRGFDPQPTFQFDSWSPTKLAALTLRAAVITALDGFTGTMGGVGGVVVQFVQQVGGLFAHDAETGLYHPTVDFRFTYTI